MVNFPQVHQQNNYQKKSQNSITMVSLVCVRSYIVSNVNICKYMNYKCVS